MSARVSERGGWLLVACLVALIVLVSGCNETTAADRDLGERVAGIYVMAGAGTGGDGSEPAPFGSLAEAEQAAAPDDVIYLLAGDGDAVLDGGVRLVSGQKLLGLGADGKIATSEPRVRMTNRTENLEGVIVQLSSGNEVAGIHFVDLRNHGIRGTAGKPSSVDLSGTHIHHVTFSGAIQSEEVLWSISLDAQVGAVEGVRVTDSVFRDGEDLAGIQILHQGDSSGSYRFARNRFSDLGGRAYHLWSQGTSSIDSVILDSKVDNIGLGDRNSDSILPHLWNSSRQTVTVSNFDYDNSKQVGNQSNTGTEAFLMGAPFPDTANYCDGCQLTLEITDSVYENPVTDGIQLINFGSNSVLDVRIRNTRVRGAKPQQVGGGISLVPQNDQNSGSQTRLLVENTDVLDSSGYGVAISDTGRGHTAIVDLGGGELGSVGNNRILDSAKGEIQVKNGVVTARNNWWGVEQPRIDLEGNDSRVDWQPALDSDPES